jgi:hypothetical protein
MKTTKELISKEKDHAFSRDVYLLGKDKNGIKYWLESPKWDCGWYWGFGYVETYQNNRKPSTARDIESHSHIDSSFMGKIDIYDSEKHCYVQSEYISNIFDCPTFAETTFNESEGWQLSELFTQFYLLKNFAAFSGRDMPGTHITTSPVNHGDLKAWSKEINEVLIPRVTAKIIEILSPKE